MRKSAFLGLALLALTSCATVKKSELKNSITNITPYQKDCVNYISSLNPDLANLEVVETLDLNLNNKRHQIAFKGEEEGIKDLRRIVQKKNFEEAFVFIPGENIWVEVGDREEWGKVYRNENIAKNFVEAFGRIVDYHIHPRPGRGIKSHVLNVFPSYNDMESIDSDRIPTNSLTGAIVSSQGLTRYWVDPVTSSQNDIVDSKLGYSGVYFEIYQRGSRYDAFMRRRIVLELKEKEKDPIKIMKNIGDFNYDSYHFVFTPVKK